MADTNSSNTTTSSAEMTTLTMDVPYLALAYKMSEATVQELVAAPTVETVQRFLRAAQTKAQECDKFKADVHRFVFRFMDLPTELRYKIYELYAQGIMEENISTAERNPATKTRKKNNRPRSEIIRQCILTITALIHTSREIRREALPACHEVASTLSKAAFDQMAATLYSMPASPTPLTPHEPQTMLSYQELNQRFREAQKVREVLERMLKK